MLANEARHFWRISQSIRLKVRSGVCLESCEDDMTEMECIATHSDHAQMRRRAVATMLDISRREMAG